MSQLDAFESRLLAELRTVVEQDREQPAPLHPGSTRHRAPWTIAAAAAAVVLGALVLVPTLQADPAWAVTRSGNGQVDVQVNRIEDADGLERALAAEGITADITYVSAGGQCAAGRYMPYESRTPGFMVTTGSDRSFRLTIPPSYVPDGGVLVVAASLVSMPDRLLDDGTRETNGIRTWVDVGVTTGPIGPCVVVPAQE